MGDIFLECIAISDLESCVSDVDNWMNENRLKMNASKGTLLSSVPENSFQKSKPPASTSAKIQ